MIKLVCFYKELSSQDKSKKLVKRLDLKTFTYLKCLSLLKSTFYKFNPSHQFILSTDTFSKITDLDCLIIRNDLKDLLIMEAIARANTNFILENSGKIILAGADHLICNSVEKFFEEEFDLGFWVFPTFDPTHRLNLSMTIVLVNKNKNNSDDINDFFEQREKICFSLEKKERQWFADQKSISLLLEQKGIVSEYHTSNKEKTIFEFGKLKIKLFPYGEKYLADVGDDGRLDIKEDTVMIDFPGHRSKEYLDAIFDNITKEN